MYSVEKERDEGWRQIMWSRGDNERDAKSKEVKGGEVTRMEVRRQGGGCEGEEKGDAVENVKHVVVSRGQISSRVFMRYSARSE